MFKALGFLLGSVLSIACLLYFFGVPDLKQTQIAADQARFEAALDKIRERKQAEAPEEPTPAEETAITDSPAAETEEDELVAEQSADVFQNFPAEPAAPQHEQVLAEQNWHQLWNPFRSEIAARGFVRQLERVTGLDYRVIKEKPGVYQVEFAYADEDDRQLRLAQISDVTGLDLSQR